MKRGKGGHYGRRPDAGASALLAPARRVGVALAALALAFLSGGTAAPAAGASLLQFAKEYEVGLKVGLQGYVYGEPLLDTQRLNDTNTSVTVPDHLGDAPANQFSHFTSLVHGNEGQILAASEDGLYSQAWLRLDSGPIVLHVPASLGRFDNVPLYTPYGENFDNIGEGAAFGQLPPGDYAIAGPGQLAGVEAVEGLKVIHSPYALVWLLPRTLVAGSADLAGAVALQAQMKLVPLSAWRSEGLNYEPPPPEREITSYTVFHVPGTRLGEDRLAYWAALGIALAQYPPPAADAPELSLLRNVGIGPGLSPATDPALGSGTLAGLRAAVALGPPTVAKTLRETAAASARNGWSIVPTGTYGTNYPLRAVISRYGPGAQTPNITVYPFTATDSMGTALNGKRRYVAHFAPGDFATQIGPSRWSLTIYTPFGFLAPNVLERHTLGDRSGLQSEADGSVNLYLQAAEPSSEAQRANWLPAPSGAFRLLLRMYGLPEAGIAPLLVGDPGGWAPPTIQPCLASGMTAAGWPCAS